LNKAKKIIESPSKNIDFDTPPVRFDLMGLKKKTVDALIRIILQL
jgi:hypothetical protein